MENIGVVFLFGLAMGLGFSFGKGFIETLADLIWGALDKFIYSEDDDLCN